MEPSQQRQFDLARIKKEQQAKLDKEEAERKQRRESALKMDKILANNPFRQETSLSRPANRDRGNPIQSDSGYPFPIKKRTYEGPIVIILLLTFAGVYAVDPIHFIGNGILTGIACIALYLLFRIRELIFRILKVAIIVGAIGVAAYLFLRSHHYVH